MKGTTVSYGSPVALVYTRPRNCAQKADGSWCGNKTKMAVTFPTWDNGLEEMSCVSLCGECLQDAMIALVKLYIYEGKEIFPYVHRDDVAGAVIDAIFAVKKAQAE